ncbi:MAG: VOC family protein [Rhizomicrobium sp.]
MFGKVCQNGYVVRDIEAAMRHWTEVLGVGPFYYIERVKMDWFRYRGAPSDAEISIALANTGDLQIELIQPRNDAPSMYRDFLAGGREGLQHMSYWTRNYPGRLRPLRVARIPGRPGRSDRRPGRALRLFRHRDPSRHGDRGPRTSRAARARSSSASAPRRRTGTEHAR